MLQTDDNTKTNLFLIEKFLNALYKVDLHINELLRHIRTSFTKSSALFKTIYKPLQLHCIKNEKNEPGIAATNSTSAKICLQALVNISTNIQFHDVLEQKLKHIKLIHNDLIQELILIKKSTNFKSLSPRAIQYIALLNSAQFTMMLDEYTVTSKQTDAALESIKQYLQHFVSGKEEEATNLDQKISGAIGEYAGEILHQSNMVSAMQGAVKLLGSISASVSPSDKTPQEVERLKRIEDTYTTQSERMVFNALFNKERKEKTRAVNEDSDADFFML